MPTVEKLENRKRPLVETPLPLRIRLPLGTSAPSSTSSIATSSSTSSIATSSSISSIATSRSTSSIATSNIFDEELTRQETPLTPPETSDSEYIPYSSTENSSKNNDGRRRLSKKCNESIQDISDITTSSAVPMRCQPFLARSISKKFENEEHIKPVEEMVNYLKDVNSEDNVALRAESTNSPMAKKSARRGRKGEQNKANLSPKPTVLYKDEDKHLPVSPSKQESNSGKISEEGVSATPPAMQNFDLASSRSDGGHLETQQDPTSSKSSLEVDTEVSRSDVHGNAQTPPTTKHQEEQEEMDERKDCPKKNAATSPTPSSTLSLNTSNPLSEDLDRELPFSESCLGSSAPESQSGISTVTPSNQGTARSWAKASPEPTTKSDAKTSGRKPGRTRKSMPDPEVPFPPFEPFREQLSKREVKNQVLHILRQQKAEEKVKKTPGNSYANPIGYIYIFTSASCPKYVKIGMTKLIPPERVKQWGKRCKFTPIYIKDPKEERFPFYWIVEHLIHVELWNERRQFKCGRCGRHHKLEMPQNQAPAGEDSKVHSEWFEISQERALEVVQRWRKWIIENQPYEHDRTLRQLWIWKHNVLMNSTDEEIDWVRWCQITRGDRLQYFLSCAGTEIRRLYPTGLNFLMYPGLSIPMLPLLAYLLCGGGWIGFAGFYSVIVLLLSLWYYCG